MAPTATDVGNLFARYYVNNCDIYGDCNYNSDWDNWGRWVLFVGIILIIVIVALSMSRINSRRRRNAGLAPRYGTGWLAGKTPAGHNRAQYNQGYPYNNNGNDNGMNGGPPAPPYSPPGVNSNYTGNTFNSGDGYYGSNGGQQSGVELQQPANAYHGAGRDHQAEPGQFVYAPPAGPPPPQKKGDGIIR